MSRLIDIRLIPASLAAVAVALETASPAPLQQDLRTMVGAVSAWQIGGDGTVYVRVRPPIRAGVDRDESAAADGDQAFAWFQTPPHWDLENEVEEMLLRIVLQSRAENGGISSLTFVGEADTEFDGSSPEKAFCIRSVGQPSVEGR